MGHSDRSATRALRRSLVAGCFLLLGSVQPGQACSLAIEPLTTMVRAAGAVVEAVVASTLTDTVDAYGTGSPLLVPREATLAVRRVLLGSALPAQVRLRFQPAAEHVP